MTAPSEAPAVTLRRAAERVRDLAKAVTDAQSRGWCEADAAWLKFWQPTRAERVAVLLDALSAEVDHGDLALQRDLVDDPDSLICRAGYLLALDVLGEKPGEPS